MYGFLNGLAIIIFMAQVVQFKVNTGQGRSGCREVPYTSWGIDSADDVDCDWISSDNEGCSSLFNRYWLYLVWFLF
jgi:hypothetical protein